MSIKELKPSEVKELLKDVIENNLRLGAEGKPTVAYCIEGAPGISKTSIVEQVVKELEHDMYAIKENVSGKEPGDLLGYPIVKLEMSKKIQKVRKEEETGEDVVEEFEEFIWVNEKVVGSFANMGYIPTGRDKMSFSKPDFIEGKEDKPAVLVLDDFNRSMPAMQNAIMDITDRQQYSSWALAPGSTVILTSNPDDGDESFQVNTLDDAQKTRFIKVKMRPSVEDWAVFAEKEKLDSRCINFLLKHPEVIQGTSGEGSKEIANPRIWTKFFYTIQGYKSFEDNWHKIIRLGQYSLPKEHLTLFHQFVKDNMDKLPTIEELLACPTEKQLLDILESVIGSGENKRIDIASIVSRRIVNFVTLFSKDISKDKLKISNLRNILLSDYMTPDLCMATIRRPELASIDGLVDMKLLKKGTAKD